jgi:hypothetical protein
MSDLVDKYLDASERYRWTPATFLKNRNYDYRVHRDALISALSERVEAGTVCEVTSKGGATAYVEVL